MTLMVIRRKNIWQIFIKEKAYFKLGLLEIKAIQMEQEIET